MKQTEFSNPRGDAASAKAARLAAFLAAKTANEPARLLKEAERSQIAAARTARQAERAKAKADALSEQLAAEAKRKADEAAAEQASIEAKQNEISNRISRVINDEAIRKAERDRRYANRKAASSRA